MLNRHLGLRLAVLLALASPWAAGGASAQTTPRPDITEARQPRDDRYVRPVNVYENSTAGQLSPAVAGALARVYVPNIASDDIYVIDPAAMTVVDHYKVGRSPQHVVPSWDLKTLWVTGSAESHRVRGSLTSIDPRTGKVAAILPMEDAYNMYFTPDGASAVVVAESRRRLEYRDPHSMQLQGSLTVPECAGINHADFAADGRYAIFTCEFTGALVKIDIMARKVLGFLKLAQRGMPQDIRISPDGQVFYVANMMTDGVSVIDGASFKEIGFIPTGVGAHGLYPSRDGKKLYVSNRGSHAISGAPRGKGSVAVIDFATRKVEAIWPVPGGGSPDMGNVSADGKQLWLAGRFDNVVYCFDTASGHVTSIPVGRTPHGVAVWPQPGRYSLGHTGVMR